jgi:TonB family protein
VILAKRSFAAGVVFALGGLWVPSVEAQMPSPPAEGAAAAAPAPEPAETSIPDITPATQPGEADPSVIAPVAPPRILTAAVAYPKQGRGEATVVLELVIDRDGSVSSARAVLGDEPFVSAALEASRSWRFAPAQRGDQPVPARIRFELHYTPPAPVSLPPAQAPDEPPPIAPLAAPAAQLTEVRVFGEIPPGSVSLSGSEVRTLPGAFGDPFRAVSVLPGVGQLVTGLPVFFARGAPSGNLGYLIDGIRVPLLFHAFLGPAVVHPRLIERVELHAGGYPASFGHFAGGVVSADLSQPRGEFNADWTVRLFDAGAFVEVPFAGGRGNVMVAGRYSYSALLLSLLSDLTLEYWDYQALASYELSKRGTLSVFAFGAYDFAASPSTALDPNVSPAQNALGDLGGGENAVLFHRVDVRYDHHFGESTKLRVATTFGTDATRGAQGLVKDLLLGGRLELRSQVHPRVLLRAGASVESDGYQLSLDPNTENFTDVVALFPTRRDSVLGAHVDAVIEAAPDVTVTPGVRVDRYASRGRTALGVSPRLAASFRVNEAVSIEHAFGVADQTPNFVPGVPAVAVAGLPGGLQRSLQTSSGVRAELPWNVSGTATLFHNSYFHLSDPFGQNQDLELDADEAAVRSTGQAYGLELLLQRRMSARFGGLLGYTLSRSTRSYGRVHSVVGYDRPHVLNIAANYDLGRRWLASARGVFYSGVPGSRTLGERRIFDQSRAAPFFRIDLRLEKRFMLTPSAWWAVTAELMNATLSREVLRRPCEPDCRDETVGPIVLPSLGVTGQF